MGCKKKVIFKVSAAAQETVEIIINQKITLSSIDITTEFEEYGIDVIITYSGSLINISAEKPTDIDFLNETEWRRKMSSLLITKYSNSIKLKQNGEKSIISLHFEH